MWTIPPAPERFVHRAGPANTAGDVAYLDDPLTVGNPDAVVSLTQNWHPGGGVGVYNDHPVGFFYDEGSGRRAMRNLDGAPMPAGAAFNVAVSGGGYGSARQRRRRRTPSSRSSPPRTRSRRAPPGP